MTITALPSRDEYTSSAGQTVFNYSFKIYESSNLDVYVTPAGQVANDAADLTTAYVVDPNTIGNPAGGLITFNSPLSNGDLVTIVSSVPYDRTVDYQVNGDFLPTTVNGDNDRQVSQIKQVLTRANRTLTYPQSLQGATSLTLPTPEAGLFLKWKTDLTGLENTDVDASFLPITGGTMAGDINMGGYNIVNIGNGFLPLSGGTMTGSINMGDNDISNIDLIVADRAVIGGSAIIPGGDFTITIAEQVTLTDGQVVVVFLADTAGATFYVNGLSVDSGLIIEDLDYQIDNVTKTMTLVNSYPAGTILTMRYFDGDSGIAPTAYDSVAAMKSTVLPIGKLVTTKGYYAPGDGGGADYLVAASQAVDGFGSHVLANGNVALLQQSGTVNCLKYGVVGIGDDTAAFQAAIDSGFEVFIPPTFTVHTTSSINVSTLATSVKGHSSGYYSSRIKCVTASVDIFTVSEGEFSCSGITFEGDGAAYGAGATVSGLKLDGTGAADVDAHINSCSFVNLNTAIKLNGRNLDVRDCLLSNSQFGIVTKATSPPSDFRGLQVQNNRFHSMGQLVVPTSVCISIAPSSNFKEASITGNYCDDSAVFFDGYASGLNLSTNSVLRGVGGIEVDTTGHGISADDRSLTVSINVISFDASKTNDRHGIGLTVASSKGTVTGNTIANSGRSGISLTSTLLMAVGVNSVSNASKDNTNVYSCIDVDANSQLNNISSNVLIKGAGTLRGIAVAGANNTLGEQTFSGFSADTRLSVTNDTTVYNRPTTTKNSGWGNADTTLIAGSDEQVQRHSTVITADRNVALSLTDAYDGATFRIIRVSGGAFNLNVRNATTGGSLIDALQPNEWLDATYIASTSQWLKTGAGSMV